MLLGVSKTGVMRVDPKTKEVLDSWDYRIIRNWAYTAKTFLLVRDDSGWQGARLGGQGVLLTGQCSFVECVGDVLSVLCLIVCLEIQLCPYFIPPTIGL